MYEIICIINKGCGIILLFGKISTIVNILLIFGDGSLYHDAIRDATKNDLPQSEKITPRNRKSVFIKDFRKVKYFFLFWRHVLYGHGAIM